MALESPEVLIMSLSKDIERLTATVAENAVLFRENQHALTQLIAELREHKAIDDAIHIDFRKMQDHLYGTSTTSGIVTKVHTVEGKIGSLWKLLWATIGSVATGGVSILFSKFGGG